MTRSRHRLTAAALVLATGFLSACPPPWVWHERHEERHERHHGNDRHERHDHDHHEKHGHDSHERHH
jgi:hypothetical protein